MENNVSDIFKDLFKIIFHVLQAPAVDSMGHFPFRRQNGEQIQQSADDQLPHHEGQVERARP